MKHLEKLKKMLCKELDELSEKGELGAGSLELVHKLTDTIKNIDKIEMLDEDTQSERGASYHGGNWEANGNYNSGNYSGRRGRGANGRYVSRAEARDDMMSMLEDARMSAGDDREREVISRAMSQLRNM